MVDVMRRLVVAIASANGPYIEIVRKAQLGITLPKVRCVDAKGLPLLEDKRHLSTLAQERLGPMLADAFLTLKRCGLTKQKYAYQSL
ncbi:putative sialate O-acetylesterase domain, SGNH hydrolase superfamily [Helianthus annuus]|nr:putative sialate O-acetylesterase domain, SGNH hydrolase superfamily [Helianthus annuus]KAJ0516150.1 putative sialate O-acetylesterase domain, SGNH hydrolase superfamily [Helianthus annuus]KAJ0688134.1 putative sialate O-acetylesterase domain, SGNH hydrolase superfamily [Helianthus annuus]KAJ0869180.1 putative sialate O-acetylesterase domain, SGNH hydrolase superfamily [Helianthus annuus]